MPNSENSFDQGLPKWLRLSDCEIDGTDFDQLTLLVLRRLYAEYPNRLDLSDCIKLKERIGEFTKIWEWLELQKVVSGPVSNCSLTLSGMQAYRKTVQLASDSTRIMLESKEGLTGAEARELVLSIFHQHYHDYVERTEDQ